MLKAAGVPRKDGEAQGLQEKPRQGPEELPGAVGFPLELEGGQQRGLAEDVQVLLTVHGERVEGAVGRVCREVGR